MATSRDWAALGFDPTLSFALPNERQLAQSLMPDSGKGAEYKFNPTAENLALLQALGYGGQGFTQAPMSEEMQGSGAMPMWSDEARTWLNNNGYNVGVAHDPGTSPGGRPEYFGLTGPDGKWVNGQSDPTMTTSDTLADQLAMFAMFLGPAIGGVASAGGAGGGAAGGLAGGASDVAALGSAWSPEALGLTGSLGSGVGASELAALSSALPGAVEVGAGLGAGAGLAGSGGAAAGGGGAAVNTLPTQVITGSSAGAGAGGGGGGLLGTGGGATAGIGGLSSADKAALYGSEGYGSGMSGGQTSVYDGILNSTGSKGLADAAANSTLGESIIKGGGYLSDLVGGGQNLAALVGAGVGAASGGGTQTSSHDPWAAAQPYLKNLLGDADAMRANLAQNPFTPQQTQAYQNAYSGLDQSRAAMPGLLNWGQQAMQRQSTTPSYAQLFGGQPMPAQPAQPGGLLNQPQPTMQAGGAGGLLGNDDRMKALMAKGRSLIG